MFSVIIPLYNKKNTIRRAVDSVLCQEWNEFELVVIDDGSTDGSAHELKSYDDRRLTLVSQSNQGVSAARNYGVTLAKYDLICFLDADDEWRSDHLSVLNDLIIEFPDAAIYSTGHDVAYKNRIIEDQSPFREFSGVLSDFFESSARYSIANSSKVAVSKDAFLAVGGFPLGVTVGEDLYLWAMLALRGDVVFSSKSTVIIHKDFDESRGLRSALVPYLVEFFSSEKKILSINKSLRKYVLRVGLVHVADSSLNRDFYGGIRRSYGVFKISYFWGIVSLMIMVTPSFILLKFKRVRD